jgi:hypothetical protein
MNNILLTEKYLIEVKSNIKNFVTQLQDYKMPTQTITGILELILCINGQDAKAEEAMDLIYTQLPELFHMKTALEALENLAQLLNGNMNFLFESEGPHKAQEFIFMTRNMISEEIHRLEQLEKMYEKQDQVEEDIMESINHMNIK